MIPVDILIDGPNIRTRVLISELAAKKLDKFIEKSGHHGLQFGRKLWRFATDGFRAWEGDHRPIRSEWRGVYRIGTPATLFRIIGFYEDDQKISFVAMDAFMKKKKHLSKKEAKRIDEVADIKESGNWKIRLADK